MSLAALIHCSQELYFSHQAIKLTQFPRRRPDPKNHIHSCILKLIFQSKLAFGLFLTMESPRKSCHTITHSSEGGSFRVTGDTLPMDTQQCRDFSSQIGLQGMSETLCPSAESDYKQAENDQEGFSNAIPCPILSYEDFECLGASEKMMHFSVLNDALRKMQALVRSTGCFHRDTAACDVVASPASDHFLVADSIDSSSIQEPHVRALIAPKTNSQGLLPEAANEKTVSSCKVSPPSLVARRRSETERYANSSFSSMMLSFARICNASVLEIYCKVCKKSYPSTYEDAEAFMASSDGYPRELNYFGSGNRSLHYVSDNAMLIVYESLVVQGE